LARKDVFRVVDLSVIVLPTNSRMKELTRFKQPETRDYHTTVAFDSHLGTHVESPFHFRDEWPDLAQLPANAFVGRGVFLKVDTNPADPISRQDLVKSNNGRLLPNDFAILDSYFHAEPFKATPGDPRPHLTAEAAEWLAEKRLKGVGFGDGISIEHDVDDSCAVHDILMRQNTILIEVMANLDQLNATEFMFICLPMPIRGLDACCVRAVAIEGIPGFGE